MPMGSETFQLNSKRSFDNSLTDIYSSFNPLTTTMKWLQLLNPNILISWSCLEADN